MNKLPNLLILGTQKAGTTAIFDWLAQHPDVYGTPAMKEFPFLIFDEFYDRGEKWFAKNFQASHSEKFRLHGFVNYMYFFERFVERYKKSSIDAKFLIVLRNPIYRAYSAYWFNKSKGIEKHQTFDEALRINVKQFRKWGFEDDADFSYLEHGLYAEQLNFLFKHLKREHFKIIIYEELIQAKQESMDDICHFLGVKRFKFDYTQKNTARYLKYPFLKRSIYELKAMVPHSIRKRIPEIAKHTFRQRVRKATSENFKYPAILAEDKKFLKDFYLDSNKKLEVLLERKLTCWEK